jgi:hypothetical protein
MANPDAVGQLNLDSFSNGRIGIIRATTLNTSGNGATTNITIPLLGGGLTNGGAVANSGGVIIRRITVMNPSGSVASANISISATSDGANLITANTIVSSVNAAGQYQDITVAAPYSNKVVAGSVTQCLFVNINTVAGNSNTADIVVWGDVVSF